MCFKIIDILWKFIFKKLPTSKMFDEWINRYSLFMGEISSVVQKLRDVTWPPWSSYFWYKEKVKHTQ